MRNGASVLIVTCLALPLGQSEAQAAEPYHPWANQPKGAATIDLAHEAATRSRITTPVEQRDFHSLDDFKVEPGSEPAVPQTRGPDQIGSRLPAGWVQRGSVVLPRDVAEGIKQVDPQPAFALEDIPGNKYPRKHTLYMNFSGGMLFTGADNSAESKSTLASQGNYPTFTGGEQKALSAIQAVENDVAAYGVRVLFEQRPDKIVPYTMAMIGGSWTDTNIDSPAAGVAPGADCGALGQRHVVYTFAGGSWSATAIANTTSQEAGHAWGLDHTFNCGSVMSYCGGGDGFFSNACDGLCESQCQGPNSAGCRLTHDIYCGEGNDAQNEDAELNFLFGGAGPDMEAPTVMIVEPAEDTIELEVGGSVPMRAVVDDNFGGFGWKTVVKKDGEVILDEIDYGKDNIDDQYRVALDFVNLEEGNYEVTVSAQDHFENVGEDTVLIVVGNPPPLPGDSGGETGGGSADGGGSGDDGGSAGQDGDGGSASDGGCAISARSGAPLWGLALPVIAAVRRRRRR